jgi:hypothetical protein
LRSCWSKLATIFTIAVAPHRLECSNVKPKELALLEIVGLPLVQHPAHFRRYFAGIARAGSGLVDVRVVEIFGLGVVVRALLSRMGSTGLSQKHCCSR